MNELRFTLVSDGSSDDALLPILIWLLMEAGVKMAIQPQWADLRQLTRPPSKLPAKIEVAIDLYHCDLLFVHRDAEKMTWEVRHQEIASALSDAGSRVTLPPTVGVVPVRMTEAFLLSDEAAIRSAAGNPNGKMPLTLPRPRDIESLAEPKEELYALLKTASGKSGRDLKRFHPSGLARRVAECTRTFALLRGIPAFDSLEADINQMVREQHWNE